MEARRGTALDASERLDKPAGRHGWVAPKGEGFIFSQTGQPVRFFGINIVAGCNFPTHQQADHLAETLAQMGVNMTRHHHMDAPWATHNVFGKAATTAARTAWTASITWWPSCRSAGSTNTSTYLLVHRQALAADGVAAPDEVANGWKVKGEFDPKLIKLQEQFIREFLGTRTPTRASATGRTRPWR